MKDRLLEEFEIEFIRKMQNMSGTDIYINLRLVENYARTQREAERLNREGGIEKYAGCSCGRLHEKDLKTGAIDTGWY